MMAWREGLSTSLETEEGDEEEEEEEEVGGASGGVSRSLAGEDGLPVTLKEDGEGLSTSLVEE